MTYHLLPATLCPVIKKHAAVSHLDHCNNLPRLEDSVFSPDKRSTDAERASLRTDALTEAKKSGGAMSTP